MLDVPVARVATVGIQNRSKIHTCQFPIKKRAHERPDYNVRTQASSTR